MDDLLDSMRYVTKLSYKHQGGINDYNKSIKVRKSDFEFKVYQQKSDPLGNPVERTKRKDGRTTFWVSSVQK